MFIIVQSLKLYDGSRICSITTSFLSIYFQLYALANTLKLSLSNKTIQCMQEKNIAIYPLVYGFYLREIQG